MKQRYDVVVIGSGSAGSGAAMALRKGGKTVLVVDERPLGGTCALRGCDPKKVFVAAARTIDQARHWRALGIVGDVPALDWAQLQRFKRTFTDPAPHKRAKQFDDAGIDHTRGRARFEGERTVSIDGRRVDADYIVIATGARELHVAQGDDALITSEQFLELEALPRSLFVVGGGYIAFELAHVAARGGAKVTILHEDDRPLPDFDRRAVAHLLAATRDAGIDVQLQTKVGRIEKRGDGVTAVDANDEARTFHAERGLLAAGRAADVDDLALEAAHVERSKKGIRVDEHLRSISNDRVYAAGDCADGGGLPLTPVAGYEGSVAAANILGEHPRTVDFRGLATIVFAIPALARVGITEDEAKQRGLDAQTHEGDMSEWYGTRHLGADAAYYSMVTEKGSGTILGATVFGPNAEAQINVLALAVRQSLPFDAVSGAFFAYPTGASDLEYFA